MRSGGRPARRTPREVLAARLRVAGAAMAATGLAALAALSAAGPAQAAAPPYNQITGQGQTDSAVTVNWTGGLLDSSNNPLTPAAESTAGDTSTNEDRSAASPTSPLSFMYNDFKDLQVTVSQTKNIRAQGITVSWTGDGPGGNTGTTVTDTTAAANFLQIMECYGDSSSGPSPEGCEYGTPGLLGTGNIDNNLIGGRSGDICAASAPSVSSPPSATNGQNPVWGCDAYEPGTEKLAGTQTLTHLDPCPGKFCQGGTLFDIPFVPADANPATAASYLYGTDVGQYFNQNDSNEVQQAISNGKGAGQVQFEALTSIQSQGLGCGETETSGQVRSCWLVIVPRGTYEPNGFHVDPTLTSSAGVLNTSPLSAANWAQRIQVHLNYAPDGQFCDLGTPVVQTSGTELASRAMASWTLALAAQDKCNYLFDFGSTAEAETTTALLTESTTHVGLGFTTIPIGSETTEDGKPPTSGIPKMLYAPVAITGLEFGFNINDSSSQGFITTQMKLTPMLLAKALTQVYLRDLPDYYPNDGILPTDNGTSTVLRGNPVDIAEDPEFTKLNPASTALRSSSTPLAPILVTGKSALNQQVWQWVDSSPATVGWLDGTAKDQQYGIVADPDYVSISPQLGKVANPTFPRSYQGVLDNKADPKVPASTPTKRDSGLLLQEQDSYSTVASDVLLANNPTIGGWNPNIQNNNGTNGNWDSVALQAVGQRYIWGLMDTPSLAAYGIIPATLCAGDGADGTGTGCVTLSEQSITAALASAKADSSGLLHVNPATVGASAWPLVDVVYAAVPVNQSADQLNQYAELISYATGAGQTPGSAPGNLPPGYLPLPASLVKQAQGVVTQLQALAKAKAPKPSASATTTTPQSSSSTTSSSTGSNGTGNNGTGNGGTGTAGTSATPSPSAGASATSGTALSTATPAPGASCPTSAAATSGTASSTATPTAGPACIIPPTIALTTAGDTPKDNVGGIRWAIVVVVIAGLGSAGAGVLLRSARMPRLPRRAGGAGP